MSKEWDKKKKEVIDKEIREWQEDRVDSYFKLFGGTLLVVILLTLLGHILTWIF